MSESFMRPEITFGEWIEVDSVNGVEWIPADLVKGDGLPASFDEIALYLECGNADSIYRIERVEGYGARLSAPGYMDSTPWSVFPDLQNAESYIRDIWESE